MFKKITKNTTPDSRFVFFTGAGISTDSGLKDFRSADGLYSQGDYCGFEPEEILSIGFFNSKPEIFYNFYLNNIVNNLALPNEGHISIAGLESIGYNVSVLTQNIDGLHSKAGSQAVYELHGSVMRNYCTKCHKNFSLSYMLEFDGEVPECDLCKSIIRPDVVLYGESLNEDIIKDSLAVIENADFLFVVGSSLTVYPATGLLKYFKGKNFSIINLGDTPLDRTADYLFKENSSYALKNLFKELADVLK